MQFFKYMAIGSILIGTTACKNPGDIPFLGLDGAGEVREVGVPFKQFRKYNAKSMAFAKEETLKALEGLKDDSENSWKLKVVSVGLAAKAGFGLGNVLKAEAEPAFVLVYKKRK